MAGEVPQTPADPSSAYTAPATDIEPPKRRLWFPLGLVGVEAVLLIAIEYLESIEILPPAEAGLARFSAIALATILLMIWFVGFSSAAAGLRRGAGWCALAVLMLTVALLRFDGVNGNVVPRLSFRWTPRAADLVPSVASETQSASPIDLLSTSPDDYPEFLGAGRRATLTNVRLARDWTAQPPKELWRRPIGAGWSSFAIVGHYAVTQEQRDSDATEGGQEELITCYDINNGKLQWAHATPVRFYHPVAGLGPRATPTVHQGKVYALGALGHLTCLDGSTGKQLWQHDIVTESGATLPVWGKSCSPLVYENLVIVSAGGPQGKSLIALDRETGQQVWSAGDDASSYSSPTLFTVAGQPQIVMVNELLVTAHDPRDGKILWQHNWPEAGGSPNVSQPLEVGQDRILLSKGYAIGSSLWQITHEGDAWNVKVLWKNNNLKTKMTSAVLRDGYAYGLDEGVLTCIEVDTGKRVWKKQKYGHGQVLLVDDLLLVQSETGDVALVEASPKAFHELTRFQAVKGQSWNYPALSGRRLLVRTEQEAACYELPAATDAPHMLGD